MLDADRAGRSKGWRHLRDAGCEMLDDIVAREAKKVDSLFYTHYGDIQYPASSILYYCYDRDIVTDRVVATKIILHPAST
jgi:triacylglycerol esterase/lipase EstA (alpha/beta hydrolase family)